MSDFFSSLLHFFFVFCIAFHLISNRVNNVMLMFCFNRIYKERKKSFEGFSEPCLKFTSIVDPLNGCPQPCHIRQTGD